MHESMAQEMRYSISWMFWFALTIGAAALAQDKPGKQDKPDKPKSEEPVKPAEEKPEEIDAPDVADIPTQDLRIDKDENRRYLLAGPRKGEKEPKNGFALLVVMPGGDGAASFHPFVKRVYQNALPDGFLVVQPVAPKWTKDQTVIWPTAKTKAEGMKFACEDFVEQVIDEVSKAKKIDPKRVYALAWSSSGPLAYILSTRKKPLVRGSFIAMSVFRASDLDLEHAKDRVYYILHSPQDTVCPLAMAEEARDTLRKKGAKLEFATYAGGHGWSGDVFGTIRTGVAWLEKQTTPKAPAK